MPTDLQTLDYVYQGTPFYTVSVSADTELLDTVYQGTPFVANPSVAPDTTLAAGSNTIAVTAPILFVRAVDRVFPNKRSEDQRESQVAHIQPLFGVQDPALIP